MRRLFGFVVTVVLAAGACNTAREELPTRPDPETAAALIPPEPTPTPPPPAPTPFPEDPEFPDTPDGGTEADTGGSCGDPTPPGISRVNVKVLSTQASRALLDATPLVGPDAAYCALIGFTDGRSFCPVRPNGHPERAGCEALRVGTAGDTGRVGPTWSADGRPCQGGTGGTSCLNHANNQYLAYAYGAGTFRACVAGGTCGKITLR